MMKHLVASVVVALVTFGGGIAAAQSSNPYDLLWRPSTPTIVQPALPTLPTLPELPTLGSGSKVVGTDGTYLGSLNRNRYDPESIANPYGRYGSRYSPSSVNNPYSKYGSPFSPQSATNPYALQAPQLYAPNGAYLGKLSANPYDPQSTANPYGVYGSPFSPSSINNPYSPYYVPKSARPPAKK